MTRRSNPEGRVQLAILHWAKAQGYHVGKIKNKGSRIGNRFIFDPYQMKGLPDLVLFGKGRMHFVEVKAPDGRQSPEQVNFQALCADAGVSYVLARSVEDVQKAVL